MAQGLAKKDNSRTDIDKANRPGTKKKIPRQGSRDEDFHNELFKGEKEAGRGNSLDTSRGAEVREKKIVTCQGQDSTSPGKGGPLGSGVERRATDTTTGNPQRFKTHQEAGGGRGDIKTRSPGRGEDSLLKTPQKKEPFRPT